jgi:hypothetical protein
MNTPLQDLQILDSQSPGKSQVLVFATLLVKVYG